MRTELSKFEYFLGLCMFAYCSVRFSHNVVVGEYEWAVALGFVVLWLARTLVLAEEPSTAVQARAIEIQSYWSPEVDGTWVLYRSGQRVRCYTCGRDVYFLQPSTSVQIECKCGGPTLIIPNPPDHTHDEQVPAG